VNRGSSAWLVTFFFSVWAMADWNSKNRIATKEPTPDARFNMEDLSRFQKFTAINIS
jgi:hypothetical protein